MVFTSDNHTYTTAELKKRRIPFKEVSLITNDGKRPAVKLDVNAWIIIQAGRLLTDN